MLEPLKPFAHSIAMFNVCGDAEAYVFDVDALTDAQRNDLVAAHLRAFADNLVRQRREPWTEFQPVALLGESMPAACRDVVDLSAPHEGTLLVKRKTGGLFYVAAADDFRAYFVADSAGAMGFRPTGTTLRGGVGDIDFKATPTTRTGFTLEQYGIAGNPLAQVIGRHTGLRGLIERLRGA